jgi:hypothetical protein
MKANRLYWALVFLLGITIFSIIGLLLIRPGIQVTVHNTGTTTLHAVVLYITGASYPVGDIAPGTATQATVRAKGESNLEIEFIDMDGKPKRLDAGGYFESGYRGTIKVSIKDGVLDLNEQKISVW